MGCFSGSSSKQTSESKTGAQKRAIDAAIGKVPGGFEGYASLLGQGANVYPGQRVAGLTPLQQGIFGQLPGFADQFGGLMGPSFLQGDLETAASGLLAGQYGAQPFTPEQENAYFARAIQDPRMKTFTQTELPGIREAFAGPGYWSSARANEEAEAYQDVGDWLGTQRAQLGWDVLGRNQQIQDIQANRILSSIAPSLAVGTAPLQQAAGALGGLGQTLGLGGMEQQQNQAQIAAEMQKFFEENQITDPQIMEIFSMLIGTPVSSSSMSQSSAGLGNLALGSLLSGAASGYTSSLFPTTQQIKYV